MKYTQEIAEVLKKLAKRKTPEATNWYRMGQTICLIYGEMIMDDYSLREHGINHVKESNLLPFL